MLQKSKTNSLSPWCYFTLIPLVSIVLLFSSCERSSSEMEGQTANLKEDIDALAVRVMAQKSFTEEEQKSLGFLSTILKNDKIDLSKGSLEGYKQANPQDGFSIGELDQVPVYPGCSGATNEELITCLSAEMSSFVSANFNREVANNLDITGVQSIYVKFKINASGTVQDVVARAKHTALRDEAIRVISAFPKMTPGMQGGENVNVLYVLPIKFEFNE